jgi:predicted nucleotidyltransferase
MPTSLFSDVTALAALCRRHHIRRLALFGSAQRGGSRPDSDVDLLVEFESGQEPGFLGLAGIEAELSALIDGRPVDLRTQQDLSRHFRAEVARTAEVQFAAG